MQNGTLLLIFLIGALFVVFFALCVGLVCWWLCKVKKEDVEEVHVAEDRGMDEEVLK